MFFKNTKNTKNTVVIKESPGNPFIISELLVV